MRPLLIVAAALGFAFGGPAQAQSPSLAAAVEAAPLADYMKWKGNKGNKGYAKARGTPYGWSQGRKVGWTKRNRSAPSFVIRF